MHNIEIHEKPKVYTLSARVTFLNRRFVYEGLRLTGRPYEQLNGTKSWDTRVKGLARFDIYQAQALRQTPLCALADFRQEPNLLHRPLSQHRTHVSVVESRRAISYSVPFTNHTLNRKRKGGLIIAPCTPEQTLNRQLGYREGIGTRYSMTRRISADESSWSQASLSGHGIAGCR
jgi:hypothetical protein